MRLIIDDIGIGISRLENRKRPSLVIITKNVCWDNGMLPVDENTRRGTRT